MPSWIIPTFEVGQYSLSAPLNDIAGSLELLESSMQLASIAESPLVGTPPSLATPSFLIDMNYGHHTGPPTPDGHWQWNFGSAFPNGVVAVIVCAADGSIPGLTVNVVTGSVTTAGFLALCQKSDGSGGIIPCDLIYDDPAAAWCALGF